MRLRGAVDVELPPAGVLRGHDVRERAVREPHGRGGSSNRARAMRPRYPVRHAAHGRLGCATPDAAARICGPAAVRRQPEYGIERCRSPASCTARRRRAAAIPWAHGLDRPQRRPRRDGRGRAHGRRRGDVRGDLEREHRLRRARGGCRIHARRRRPGRALRCRGRGASVLPRSRELRARADGAGAGGAHRDRHRAARTRSPMPAPTSATSSRTARSTTRSPPTPRRRDAVVARDRGPRRTRSVARCRCSACAARSSAPRAPPDCRSCARRSSTAGTSPTARSSRAARPARCSHDPAPVADRARPPRARGRGRGGRRHRGRAWMRHPSASTATRPTRSRWPAPCAPRSTRTASRCARRGERGDAPRILPMGDRAVLLEVDSLDGRASRCTAGSRHRRLPGVLDLVPAARTVLVRVDPARLSLAAARAWIAGGDDGCRIRPLRDARGRRARGRLRRRRPRRDRGAARAERRRARAPAHRGASGRSRSPASRRASGTS